MAKYKNREVTIIEDLPHPNGGQVKIQHMEPGTVGFEIVPKNQVWVTDKEKKAIDDARQVHIDNNDYRLIGKDQPVTLAPTTEEVRVQRMAEDNLKYAEEQKKEQEEWLKKHPQSSSEQKRALDAIKVVPYRDETPTKVEDKATSYDVKKVK